MGHRVLFVDLIGVSKLIRTGTSLKVKNGTISRLVGNRSFLSGGLAVIRAARTLMSMKYYRTDRAFDPFYLHNLVLQDVTEFFNIRSGDKRYYVKFTCDFVQFFHVRHFGECANNIVHVRRIDENVHESKKSGQSNSTGQFLKLIIYGLRLR